MGKTIWTALFISTALIAFGQETPSGTTFIISSSRPFAEINKEYPFNIKLINGSGTDSLLSSELLAANGKPTVVAFWLTTCVPCRYELAAISSKYQAWQKERDFNFYAVSIDFSFNYENYLKRVKESNWPFPAYYDIRQEFQWVLPGNLNGLPQTFVFDKNGKIVHHTRKYSPGDEDALFDFIKSM